MIQARDILDRFRPVGAPGAAGRAGVPADRTREQAAELDPVLALLDDVQAECEQIVELAGQEAERIAGQARAEATAIAEESSRLARSARQEAMQAVLDDAHARAQAPIAAAEREAARIRQRSQARMPDLAARAVSLVRAVAEPQP